MVSKVEGRGPIGPPLCLRVTFFTLCLLGLKFVPWRHHHGQTGDECFDNQALLHHTVLCIHDTLYTVQWQ